MQRIGSLKHFLRHLAGPRRPCPLARPAAGFPVVIEKLCQASHNFSDSLESPWIFDAVDGMLREQNMRCEMLERSEYPEFGAIGEVRRRMSSCTGVVIFGFHQLGSLAPRVQNFTLTVVLPVSPRCHNHEIINESVG
jgi:hypothetical protein